MYSFVLWVQVFMIIRAKECSSHNNVWKWRGFKEEEDERVLKRMGKKKMKREWNVFENKIRERGEETHG